MRRLTFSSLLVAAGFLVANPAAAQTPSLVGLGPVPGATSSQAFAISPDGRIVVGGPQAFRWSATSGMQGIGTLPGEFSGNAHGVNHDGSIIVGNSGTRAFWWDVSTGMQEVSVPSVTSVGLNAVSPGGLAVGAYGHGSQTEAFLWSPSTGVRTLSLPGISRGAGAISADGHVVVGWAGNAAFRWTEATGAQLISYPSASMTSAYGVSADGSVIVGSVFPPQIPFRWSEATGVEPLPLLPGHTFGVAMGVSADGRTIVGSIGPNVAALWIDGQAYALADLLVAGGVNLDGWQLARINAVSADGLTLVGLGHRDNRPEAFVATIPVPSTGAALLAGLLIAMRRRRS